MIITTLIDNLVYTRNLLAEHGLSFYIEVPNASNQNAIGFAVNKSLENRGSIELRKAATKILFDCGQSSIFVQNAHNLGIDLKEIDIVVISHGHYDHTGGLAKFLEINKTAKIYIREEALLEKQNHGNYIGMPIELFKSNPASELAKNNKLTNAPKIKTRPRLTIGQELIIDPERVVFPTEQITKLSESLYLATFPNKESKTDQTKTTSAQNSSIKQNNTSAQNSNLQTGFTILQDGEHIKDCFSDEQYLVYINNNKISLVTGCSHRGILNIIAQIELLFNLPVCEIVGGLHTQKQSKIEIEKLAQQLNNGSVQSLKVNHCTGVEAFAILKANLKCNISYNYTGNHFKSFI